jgi:hypothetical protein
MLFFVVFCIPMIEHLDFYAARSFIPAGVFVSLQAVECFFGRPNKDARITCMLQMPPLDDQLKVSKACFERNTPIGFPVQCATPSFHVQVSASQLPFSKSASPKVFQPGPMPSINARFTVFCATEMLPVKKIASENIVKTTVLRGNDIFMRLFF